MVMMKAINPYIGHPKDHRANEKLWERFHWTT